MNTRLAHSRRRALALLLGSAKGAARTSSGVRNSFAPHSVLRVFLGGSHWLGEPLAAAGAGPLVRMAISETMVTDVNLSDARAAMQIWLKSIMVDLRLTIEFSPKVFDTTEDILRRFRNGQLDAAALNIIEYRQIADLLEPSEILVGAGTSGPDQYLLLVKKNSGLRRVADLRGLRTCISRTPKMCVADAWITTLLEDGRLGGSADFFGSIKTDTKVSRVILPVFFGQADACFTYKRGFEMMCELNPQVGRELTVIAISPMIVACFYAFRKNFPPATRHRIADLHSGLLANPAGRQLAALLQFDELTVRDASCLAGALGVLEAAERARGKRESGSRNG